MELDAKAQEISDRVGDYSLRLAMEKGIISEEEKEYLLKMLVETYGERNKPSKRKGAPG
jgi:hypothetical protein